MDTDHRVQWRRFYTDFLTGAFFGGFVGIVGVLFQGIPDDPSMWLMVPISVVFFGLGAGYFGEPFWKMVEKLGPWI